MKVGIGRIRYGNWVSLQKGEVVDLDVLVAERPGGKFGTRLYIQRQGETYPMKGPDPILPIFQLGASENWKEEPVVSAPRESSVWGALR